MREAGLKLIGPGDITRHQAEAGQCGGRPITMHHYHAELDNPENKRFRGAWKKESAQARRRLLRGRRMDGMAAIVSRGAG